MPTPSDPGQPHGGPPLEPVHVLRPRRTDALAELLKEFERGEREDHESVTPSGPVTGPQDDTRELPPVAPGPPARPPTAAPGPGAENFTQRGPAPGRPPPGRRAPRAAPHAGTAPGRLPRTPAHPARHGPATRRAAVAIALAAAAVLGFGGAVLLLGRPADDRAAPDPRPTASPPAAGSAAPPRRAPAAPGFLGEGDSGPEVAELQERLLRVPDVYRDGTTSGRYDAALSAAVARFQLWYGVRGDETGVYGDDTRRALESRTG
ncbi:peptidoglycan-binding domain-containing protein [Streptomyces prasinopilosus]|uniref:Putative peptidoglycan binding domain-containing protein n=1 Tax=Streptomyces prasinopilosus TaxID=67344 RepID=A0A1G6TGF4_9ACTN|nr:peptidoglycan-binding domain-containing protein [Streptomyces prasinopilosus]SDD28168.1 Putative peptidoglycan binding domain-containing protein [Streptomyces prasinopilosus]